MKTAVSIPDPIFRGADRLAKKAKVSRSEFYSRALAEYIRRHSPQELTREVNEFAKKVDTSLPPDLRANANRILREVEW